jgi:hypothetical protein
VDEEGNISKRMKRWENENIEDEGRGGGKRLTEGQKMVKEK